MSLIKNIFQNFRKPKNNLIGRWIVKSMNFGHNKTALWCIEEHIKPTGNEDVLDIGCGGGQNIANFLKRTNGKVFGMDYSPTCVEISQRKNREAIQNGRAKIVEADVAKIPFDDNTFDIVTAFETIYFWSNIEDAFKEVLRVLKPGGKFYICNEAYRKEGNEIWEKNIDMRIYAPIEMQELLTKTGFTDISYDIAPNSKLQRICVQGTKASPEQ